jgi:hypothetical protein
MSDSRRRMCRAIAICLDAEAWLPRRLGSTAGLPATQEVAMSETPQDRPDEADEETQEKPGEPDTDTMGGFPEEAPDSKDGEEQSKPDQ